MAEETTPTTEEITPTTEETTPTTEETTPTTEGPTGIDSFPEEAQRMIRELRSENAKTRVNAKESAAEEAREAARTELTKEFGKLLGYESGDEDETPTVDDLTSQLTSEREATRSAILELEIYKAAGEHKLDPEALLDSRKFMEEIAELDPSGKDFSDSVSSILDSAAKSGRYKTLGQVPPQSNSSDHPQRKTSGSGGENLSSSELADLVVKRRGY